MKFFVDLDCGHTQECSRFSAQEAMSQVYFYCNLCNHLRTVKAIGHSEAGG